MRKAGRLLGLTRGSTGKRRTCSAPESYILGLHGWVERWKVSMKDGTLELRKFFQGTPQNRNVCYAQSPPSVLVKEPPGVKL